MRRPRNSVNNRTHYYVSQKKMARAHFPEFFTWPRNSPPFHSLPRLSVRLQRTTRCRFFSAAVVFFRGVSRVAATSRPVTDHTESPSSPFLRYIDSDSIYYTYRVRFNVSFKSSGPATASHSLFWIGPFTRLACVHPFSAVRIAVSVISKTT